MQSLIKNILAVVLAILAAGIISYCIIVIGHLIVPPPEIMDTNDFDSIKRNFHLFQTKHFLFPLFAHMISTFVAS
jgi:hypothetical protein